MTSNPYSPPKKEVCPPATEVGWLNKVGLVSLIFIFLGFLLCSLDLAGINILWDWLTILL